VSGAAQTPASRAGSNALWLLLQGLAGSVFGLLQMKLFTVSLGAEVFSRFLVLRGFAVLLAALGGLGLPSLAQRFLPQLEVRGERARLLRVAILVTALSLAAFALTALLARLFWAPLAGRFAPAAGEGGLYGATILLALALALAELAAGLYQGVRRMGPLAVAEFLSLAGLTVHLYLVRGGLDAAGALRLFAWWFLGRAVLLLALLPLWLPPASREAAGAPLRITRRQLADYWLYSLPLRWLGIAYFELDRYVVGLVAALELVALFHVPARLVGVSKRFLAAPVLSFQAEVSRLYEERRERELARRLRLLVRGQLAVSLWLAAALFLAGRPLILLLSTERYLMALPLLGLLLLTLPLGSLVAALEGALRGLDGLGAVLLGNLLWALAYYGALPWFIGRWGLAGLGYAQLLGGLAQALVVLLAAARRGWLAGAAGELLRGTLWSLLPALGGAALAFAWPGRTGLAPATAGLVSGLALLALLAALVLRGDGLLTGEEKGWLLARLPQGRLRRGAGRLLGGGEARA